MSQIGKSRQNNTLFVINDNNVAGHCTTIKNNHISKLDIVNDKFINKNNNRKKTKKRNIEIKPSNGKSIGKNYQRKKERVCRKLRRRAQKNSGKKIAIVYNKSAKILENTKTEQDFIKDFEMTLLSSKEFENLNAKEQVEFLQNTEDITSQEGLNEVSKYLKETKNYYVKIYTPQLKSIMENLLKKITSIYEKGEIDIANLDKESLVDLNKFKIRLYKLQKLFDDNQMN